MIAPFRQATPRETGRLERTLVAAKVFPSVDEMRATIRHEQWRVQVSSAGDVAVLARWRDHLPVLAVDALWCPARSIPAAMQYFLGLGRERGFEDVVSPPTPREETAPYEEAGMHVHTVVRTYVLGGIADVPGAQEPAGVAIRPAGHRDVPRLLAVDSACFEPFWRYDTRHLVRFCSTGRLAVAERGGEAVGYTLCTVDGDDGLLGRLCVLPDFRREGIGTALLADAVRHVARQGGVRVTLSTQVENEPSQALYRSAGFHETGRHYAFMRFGGAKGR